MDPEIIGALSALGGAITGGGIAIMARRGVRPPPPPPPPCITERCQRRVECIAKYEKDPTGYATWLEGKGENYQTDCVGIPPSTDRLE